jgi:hypothetical protein
VLVDRLAPAAAARQPAHHRDRASRVTYTERLPEGAFRAVQKGDGVGRTTNKSARTAELAKAREKAAAARIAQKRAEQRRRAVAIITSVVVVALVVAAGVFYGLTRPTSSNKAGAASPALVKTVTGVSQSTTDPVGAGKVATKPQTISGTPLGTATKPTLLYIGAEFCPFCAAQRWALVNAMSRFGTISGLQTIRSKEDNLATFTFTKVHYTSPYVTFDAKEQADQKGKPLQPLTKVEQAQWTTYLGAGESSPGYPFMDLNGRYVFTNYLVDPTLLSGKSWTQIAAAMAKPSSSDLGKAEIGAANIITSAICQETHSKPASVCTPSIMALTSSLSPYVKS